MGSYVVIGFFFRFIFIGEGIIVISFFIIFVVVLGRSVLVFRVV